MSDDVEKDLAPEAVLVPGRIVDVFTTPDGSVVLVADPPLHRVARLSPLGVEILEIVGDGCTVEALEGVLLHRLGAPPAHLGSLPELVAVAVAELVESSVLTVDSGTNRTNGT